jgi:tetratricopeptide (TPR) repeat protein
MKTMIAVLFLAAYISYPQYSHSSNALDKSNTQHVEMNNAALKRYLDFGGPNIMKIEHLISSHDFRSIESWYEQMLQQYKKDAQYEWYLQQGYETFNRGYAISLTDLDMWVKTTGSYISYAARGIYKAQQRLNYEPKTKQQIHDEAAKDLQIAISKNPSLMPAYTWLIILARDSKMTFTPKQILEKAEKNDRRTYIVRYNYILSLQPQKGGSYQKMREFAEQMVKHVDSNPRLWSLQGEADADQANRHYEEGNYSLAIASYTAALKFGDRTSWLIRRAECYEKIGKNDKAMADFEKVRYYDFLDSSVKVRFAQPDVSDLNYIITEKSYIDPKLNTYNIQSYVVLPVEHHVQWLDVYKAGPGLIKKNINKIELLMMRLGKDCVERSKLDAILKEQALSLTGLTNEKAQYVGKLINADAVVIATIPSMGLHSTQSTFFEDIDIKAVSVATGKILWKSLLKGSVVAPQDTYNNDDILDTIETKLYELLESKLRKGNNT